jgi:hypothetical protein
MSAHELTGNDEGSLKGGAVKQQFLGLWQKVKKLAKDVERSMDHYDETHLRGL